MNKDKPNYLREIAQLVALDLPGYEVAPLPDDAEHWQQEQAYFVAGGGPYVRGQSKAIYMHVAHYRDCRLSVSGCWPGACQAQFGPREDVTITIHPNRPPKAIAKDIQRRLLAWYDGAWEEAVKRRNSAVNEEAAHNALKDKLAAIMGPDVYRMEHDHKLRVGDVTVNVHHSDRASLEIHYGNPSLVEKVLRALEAVGYFTPVCSNTECLKPATKFTQTHGGRRQWWCDDCYAVELAHQVEYEAMHAEMLSERLKANCAEAVDV